MQYQLAWDDLRLVGAIADAGNLRRAAGQLGIDHSTVFRRLRALEQQLGVRLFDRSRQHCVPTAAGAEAAAAAGACAEQIDRLMLSIAGADTRLSGQIRITTTDTMLYGSFPGVIAGFQQQHPQVGIELVETRELLNLTRREADIALRPTQEPPENLVGRPVADIRFSIWGHRDQFEPGGMDELRACPWVATDGSLTNWRGSRWLAENVPDAAVRLRINTLMGVFAAVAAGSGVGLLPDYLAAGDPQLQRLSAPIEALQARWWLLTHPELRHVARIRAVIDYLAAELPVILERG